MMRGLTWSCCAHPTASSEVGCPGRCQLRASPLPRDDCCYISKISTVTKVDSNIVFDSCNLWFYVMVMFYSSSSGFGDARILTIKPNHQRSSCVQWYRHTLDLKECRGTLSSGKSIPRWSSNISSDFLMQIQFSTLNFCATLGSEKEHLQTSSNGDLRSCTRSWSYLKKILGIQYTGRNHQQSINHCESTKIRNFEASNLDNGGIQ